MATVADRASQTSTDFSILILQANPSVAAAELQLARLSVEM